MKFKSAIWLPLLLATACAHHESDLSLAQDFTSVEAEEAEIARNDAPPLPSVPVAERAGLVKYVETLVSQEEMLKDLRTNGPTTVVDKAEEGFLEVKSPVRPGESYTFTLLRGDKNDLVLREKKDCSPDCAYTYAAYEFAGPAYRRVLLSSIFPMGEIGPQVRKIVPKLGRKAGVVPNWPRVEHLRLRQKPEEKMVPLYVLREITRKKREELTYFDVGTLRWDPSEQQFAFRARPRAVSLGALDGGRDEGSKSKKRRRKR